jgi:hypothetical protein
MDFIIERWSSRRGPDWHRVGLRRDLSVDLSDPRRELRSAKTAGTRQARFAAGVPAFWRLAALVQQVENACGPSSIDSAARLPPRTPGVVLRRSKQSTVLASFG